MCMLSYCSQLLYGLLMLACLVLTAVALFTNSWSQAEDILRFDVKYEGGIMPFNCFNYGQSCHDWWNSSPDSVRATAILMCIALGLEAIALIWCLISLFSCCARKYIMYPLCPLAILACLCLLSSVIIYGINNKDIFTASNIAMTSLGWSFWLAVSATVLAAISAIVAVISISCAAEEL